MIAKSDGTYDSKNAIMPSKSAATYDSKSASLIFLSTENTEISRFFKSAFSIWTYFLTHFLPISANFRLYRKEAHDIIYLRVGIYTVLWTAWASV